MTKQDLLYGTPNIKTLQIRQSYTLGSKVVIAEQRIREWYEFWNGQVYIAFSGGKDSTVLLHLVRNLYPDVPAVFVDTGLEFPEIRDFVKTVPNTIWLRPKLSFKKVIEKYGYPIISKKVAMGFDRVRNTKNSDQIKLRLYGGTNKTTNKHQYPTIPKKWHYLLNAPFKISEQCCDIMKKRPMHQYEKQSSRKPFIGMMASDSDQRKENYLKFGCNAFETTNPRSLPLAIWKENDIWKYIKKFNISYSSIYNIGYERTGCMFCGFGCHLETTNRFDLMKKTHPKQYQYCMEKLGLKKVLEWYPEQIQYETWD